MTYLTAKELQEKLNISRSTLYRLREKGLPNKKIGYRTIRYDLEEVLEWLDEQKKKGQV
jgi:excisionase family DNA binding protein